MKRLPSEEDDEQFELGSFIVRQGMSFIVTDPCYERGTWCQGFVDNLRPGEWVGKVRMSDGVVASLSASLFPTPGGKYTLRKAPFEVGVDSGQAGIFFEHLYPHGDPGEYGDISTFYGRACEATQGGYDQMPEGFVCSSGYGDGGYNAYVMRDEEGLAVAVEVVFVENEDDEDED